MRSEVLTIATGERERVVDVTDQCEAFLATVAEGADGLLHVFVPHATAGLALIETGSGSDADLLDILRDILPPDAGWRFAFRTCTARWQFTTDDEPIPPHRRTW